MTSTLTTNNATLIHMATTDSPIYKGKFRYVAKGQKLTPNPNLYHLPPLSDFNDVLTLPVTDIRPSLTLGDNSPFKLPYHGFTARHEPSKLHSAPYSRESWNDEELIKNIYMPEVIDMVKRITGCKNVMVESAVLRSVVHSEVDSLSTEKSGKDFKPDDAGPCPRLIGFSSAGGASPAPKVHLDFSPLGARAHIRKYHRHLALAAEPVIEAENKLLKSGVKWNQLKDHYHAKDGENCIPRFALFSIWRPLRTVHRDPLALSSCASFPISDYVSLDIVQPSGRDIPPHLSQIIDSANPETTTSHEEKANVEEEHTHFSNSYLAYAPKDKESKGHNWHFISEQTPEDVLVIQLFDNEMEATYITQEPSSDVTVSGVMHSAFELEGQDDSGPARESLEVRVVAFW